MLNIRAIFHPRKRRPSVLAIAALLVASSVSASAQITIDNTLNVGIPGGDDGATGLAIVASYDASGADKLVVVISSEHGFGIGFALSISSIEYNGQPMIEAVQEETLPGTTALFYLDSPGAAGEIRLFTGNKNGGLATVYALSGVAPGVAAIGQSTLDAVNITTTSANSLVIAAILDGGQASNGNGAVAPTAPLPMTQVHSGIWGVNNWGGHGSGYEIVAAPGAVTMTFGTAGPLRLRTVAAAFGESGAPGSPYCFGDGTGAQCPCSAFSLPGEGCPNTGGTGAVLLGLGNASASNDTFQLDIVGVPGAKPGLILKGDSQVAIPAGDGILCTTGNTLRSHVQVTDGSGATTYTDFNGAPFGSIANLGTATNFQFWYRDPANTCTGSGFNFSNAWAVTWLP